MAAWKQILISSLQGLVKYKLGQSQMGNYGQYINGFISKAQIFIFQ